MAAQNLHQYAFKLCGALALGGTLGYLGCVGTAALATTIGASIVIPFLSPASADHIVDQATSIVGNIVAELSMRQIDRDDADREARTNHHVTRAILGSLLFAVSHVRESLSRQGLDREDRRLLDSIDGYLAKVERNPGWVDRFGRALAATLESSQPDGKQKTATVLAVEAVYVPETARRTLSLAVETMLRLALADSDHYADGENARRVVALVTEEFQRDLGAKVTRVMARDPLIKARFDTVSAELQARTAKATEGRLADMASTLATIRNYLELTQESQVEIAELLTRLDDEIRKLGSDVDAIRKLLLDMGRRLASLRDDMEAVKGTLAELHLESSEQLELLRSILQILRSRYGDDPGGAVHA